MYSNEAMSIVQWVDVRNISKYVRYLSQNKYEHRRNKRQNVFSDRSIYSNILLIVNPRPCNDSYLQI
jgi:hypothetical protein